MSDSSTSPQPNLFQRLRASVLARALLVLSVIAVTYPLAKSQPRDQRVQIEAVGFGQPFSALRIEWESQDDARLAGVIERAFDPAHPCAQTKVRECLVREGFRAPDGSYILRIDLTPAATGRLDEDSTRISTAPGFAASPKTMPPAAKAADTSRRAGFGTKTTRVEQVTLSSELVKIRVLADARR